MYFPTLSNLQESDMYRKALDEWLGSRRAAVRKHLSPLQFAVDTDIDEGKAINLFFECTQPDVGLLKVYFVVECPYCNAILGVYDEYVKIPSSIICDECGGEVETDDDHVIVWFELLLEADRSKDNVHPFGLTREKEANQCSVGEISRKAPSILDRLIR